MPETKDSTHTTGKSIGRFSIGVNVLLQVVIGFFLFGVVNYLSWRTHKRWDLSAGKSHTLSERTVNFLESMEKAGAADRAVHPRHAADLPMSTI